MRHQHGEAQLEQVLRMLRAAYGRPLMRGHGLLRWQCRHRDGVWRSADELPLTQDQRIQAHIALDGHGSYPQAGLIPRVFFAFNDRTSSRGVNMPFRGWMTMLRSEAIAVTVHSLSAAACDDGYVTWHA